MHLELKHIKDFRVSTRDKCHGESHWDTGVWANFVKYKDGYIGSARTGNCWDDDHIEVFHMDENFTQTYNKTLTPGEDPRTFLYKGVPHCLTWHPHGNPSVFDYKLINLVTEEIHHLKIDKYPVTETKMLGKNWVPLVKDNQLYFLLTIDPQVCIIKYDDNTHECEWLTSDDNVQNITTSRGGTSCVFSKTHDCFLGIGHRTHSGDRHAPFLFTMSSDLSETKIHGDALNFDGVFDPLSLYESDGKMYCCVGTSKVHLISSLESKASIYEVIL